MRRKTIFTHLYHTAYCEKKVRPNNGTSHHNDDVQIYNMLSWVRYGSFSHSRCWLSLLDVSVSVYYVAVRTIVLSRHGINLARPVIIHDIIHGLIYVPSTPCCGFFGVSPDGNCAYFFARFFYVQLEVSQTSHLIYVVLWAPRVHTAPGSPSRSPIQLWTGRDVAELQWSSTNRWANAVFRIRMVRSAHLTLPPIRFTAQFDFTVSDREKYDKYEKVRENAYGIAGTAGWADLSTRHHIKPSPKGSGLIWWLLLRWAHLAFPTMPYAYNLGCSM